MHVKKIRTAQVLACWNISNVAILRNRRVFDILSFPDNHMTNRRYVKLAFGGQRRKHKENNTGAFTNNTDSTLLTKITQDGEHYTLEIRTLKRKSGT